MQKLRFGRAPMVLGAILILMAGLWLARPNVNQPASLIGVEAYAIQKPSPSAVLAALPELRDKPMVLEFRTRMCRDCQALAPLLSEAALKHPGVTLLVYDVDKSRETRPAVFELFQPVTVPTLVALNQQGQIKQVLYEMPPRTQLKALFDELSRR